MNGEPTLLPARQPVDVTMDVAEQGDWAASPQADPLRKLKRAMRGRWHWAILAMLLLGGGFAFAGFRLAVPVYVSTGMIKVESQPTRVLYQTPENEPIRMYNAYAQTQARLIASPRVLLQATRHESMADVDFGDPTETMGQLRRDLKVQHDRGSELISVSFTHERPTVAKKVVGSVMDAYMELYGKRALDERRSRRDALERHRDKLRRDVQRLRDEHDRITRQFLTPDVETLHDVRMRESLTLKAEVQQIEMTLVDLGLDREQIETIIDAPPQTPEEAKSRRPVSAESLAEIDPRMRRLLDEMTSLQLEIDRMELRLGEQHREVVRAKEMVSRYRGEIAAHVERFGGQAVGFGPMAGDLRPSLDEYKGRYRFVRGLFDEAQRQLNDTAERLLQLRQIEIDRETFEKQLRDTEQHIEQLNVEQSGVGRIEIASEPDDPFEPERDYPKLAAAGGGFAGALLGFTLVAGIALRDRRIRNLEHAQDIFSPFPLLGMLPLLPEKLKDAEQAAFASHCVHQIRTKLQIASGMQTGRVYTVTSPAPRNGKTSLTLSLGLSYAAAGVRTLLIDCDLGFGGLTQRLNAHVHRQVLELLVDEGLMSQDDVLEARREARQSGRPLSQVLLAGGKVKREDLRRMLELQKHGPLGLGGALAGQPLEHCVRPTGIANLSILPSGPSQPQEQASKLSPALLRKLLEPARRQYDIVLADTGSILGSLEASQLGVESDAMLLIVSQGERADLLTEAVDRMMELGANVAGVVFNRAAGREIDVVSQRSMSSMTSGGSSRLTGISLDDSEQVSRLGPVARAVISLSRSAGDAKRD